MFLDVVSTATSSCITKIFIKIKQETNSKIKRHVTFSLYIYNIYLKHTYISNINLKERENKHGSCEWNKCGSWRHLISKCFSWTKTYRYTFLKVLSDHKSSSFVVRLK